MSSYVFGLIQLYWKNEIKKPLFFTQLYHYDFINDCAHKQERDWTVDPNSSFGKELAELDKSPLCSEPEFILPKKDVIEIMELNTPNKIVKYLLSKI